MTNLDCVKKQRHHLADKGPYGQCYSHICESWTIKKNQENKKLSAEELMVLNYGVGEDS